MASARTIIRLCAVVTLVAIQMGCRYTVRPPTKLTQPVTVYLVDYGDTSRIWLPESDGRFTEWGYGDWRWYALDQNDLLYGPIALLAPTQGTLGRHDRDTGPWLEDGSLLPDLVGYATDVYEIDVEREASAALSGKLWDRYDAARDSQHINHHRQMFFVKDPSCYWIGHQSTTVAAGWLGELGCEVSGFSLKSNYDIRGPGRHVETAGQVEPATR